MTFFQTGITFLVMQTCLFAFADEKTLEFGQVANISVQKVCAAILHEVYNKAQIPIKMNLLPGRRTIIEITKGNLDGEVCRDEMFIKGYQDILKVVPPIYLANSIAVAKRKLELTNNDINSFAKYRIGIIKGIPRIEKLTSHMKSVTAVNTIEQLVQMLMQDRIDLFITSEFNTKVALKNMKIDTQVKYIYHINQIKLPLYHFILKKHMPILSKIQNIILQMQKSGELELLQKKFEQEVFNSISE